MKRYFVPLQLCLAGCVSNDALFSPVELSLPPAGASEDGGTGGVVAPPSGEPKTTPSQPGGDAASVVDGGLSPADAALSDAALFDAGVDVTPPVVVAVAPEDGATGVESGAAIVVTFSEPMDEQATEAAYASDDLPAADVTFSWNADGTVLTVTPNQPLELAQGLADDDGLARRYAYGFSGAARDPSGNLLEEQTFSFLSLRQLTQSFAAVPDRDRSGNFRGDASYGLGNCGRDTATTVCFGDNADNLQYRGFVTFDLSALPAALTRVTAAALSFDVTNVNGDAFGSLGSLLVEPLTFSEIGVDAFDAPETTSVVVPPQDLDQTFVVDVATLLTVEAGPVTTAQFRIRFEGETDSDDVRDEIHSELSTQALTLTFLVP